MSTKSTKSTKSTTKPTVSKLADNKPSAKKSLTIIKVTKASIQSKQLETFVKSLGITNNIELYKCNDLIYINAEILLPILSVPITWFIKNAEMPLHYITVDNRPFINKYGMTKLIGQSKEIISLRLQDYLYDLFYNVEVKGFVSADDLSSREDFISAMQDEIKLYKSINDSNKLQVAKTEEAHQSLRCDYAIVESNNTKLQDLCDTLAHSNRQLNFELDHYKEIALKLAKYVRVKSKNPPPEVFEDGLDDDDYTDDSLQITKDAIKARKSLQTTKSLPKQIPQEKTKTVVNEYYILRSKDSITDSFTYRWDLTDLLPDKELIEASESFLTGEVDDVPYDGILYQMIHCTKEKKDAIVLFFSLNDSLYDESVIANLLR